MIAARVKGYAPSSVHIDFDVRLPNDGTHAHILIEPKDSVRLLDLRCLVGLMVFIHGEEPARTAQTFEACLAAGARRVVSFCGDEMEDSHARAVA